MVCRGMENGREEGKRLLRNTVVGKTVRERGGGQGGLNNDLNLISKRLGKIC